MLNIPVILILGAFGGLLNHLYFHNNNLILPGLDEENGKKILGLGFLAEVILGIGGALVAAFLLVESGDLFRQAAIALLGGFGGGGLLAQNAANLERQRALAFQEISQTLVTTLNRMRPQKLAVNPLELSQVLKELERANSRQRIGRLRQEALSILQEWVIE